MPSFKMKAQSSTGCLLEKNCLRVCQRSSVISKKACVHARKSEHTEDFDTCKNCQEVSSSTQVSTIEIGSDEATEHQEFLGEQTGQIQQQSCDSPTKRMDSFHACPSNLETIFSPALESGEVNGKQNSEPNADIDAGLGTGDSDDNGSSCNNRNCDVSDFYISDMIISSLPFDENAFHDDISEMNYFPDYKYAETNMFFDVSEQYMVLPFLEDTIRSSNFYTNDDKSYEEAMVDTNCAGMYLGIGQISPCNQETVVNSSDADQAESFDCVFTTSAFSVVTCYSRNSLLSVCNRSQKVGSNQAITRTPPWNVRSMPKHTSHPMPQPRHLCSLLRPDHRLCSPWFSCAGGVRCLEKFLLSFILAISAATDAFENWEMNAYCGDGLNVVQCYP